MHGSHLVDHIRNHDLESDSVLHVVGVVSNPVRYHSRYRLYREWEEVMKNTPHVQLHTVEAAFGDRRHEITQDCQHSHLRVRTHSEIWIKENMINLGVRHLLPLDWRYMAWVDCDVLFRDPKWAIETIHQLQHHPVIQPWQDCLDLGPNGNVFRHFKGFGYQHQRRIPKQKWPAQPYTYAHSGYAWACRRDFWENIGGLMDFCILGSGDHHMAFGMIGEVDDTIHKGMSPSFFRRCREWQQRALKVTHREVGYAPGRIEHFFHGPKKRRYYRERWSILVNNGFDPDKHLMYDSQGVLQLVNNPQLEQEIRLYNRSRCEDSIDEE